MHPISKVGILNFLVSCTNVIVVTFHSEVGGVWGTADPQFFISLIKWSLFKNLDAYLIYISKKIFLLY